MDEKDEGIIGKYHVQRIADLQGKHDGCWYFVLDPKHDPIARIALAAYANAAADAGYTRLANNLDDRLGEYS